jgi:metallo-beta-lactamase family protein
MPPGVSPPRRYRRSALGERRPQGQTRNMSTPTTLRFLGGTGTVTGSKFLVERGDDRTLVDCGLFQGTRALRRSNWDPLPVSAASIDRVVISHAHLDHVGFLPRLVRGGFDGPVYVTRSTAELAAIILRDSARLQEEEAEYANRKGYSKHHPALPLYTSADADRAIERFRETDFATPVWVGQDVELRLTHAGHILGAASVTLTFPEATSMFSGDLGRPQHPLLRSPDAPTAADVIVMESTYGDRRHDDEESEIDRLARAITGAVDRGGVIIIPAFAVDRTEVLLMTLARLARSGRIPTLPVFVDSPMALAVLAVYRRAINDADSDILDGDWSVDPFDQPGGLYEMHTPEESKSLNTITEPAIIVSASGMAAGGRVLHHLSRRLGDDRNLVVLVGYQAPGTRGRSLLDGEPVIKMLGRYIPVRAQVVGCGAFSAHADAEELIAWLSRAPSPPETVYTVHGEPSAASELARRIRSELGWTAVAPSPGETVRITRQ